MCRLTSWTPELFSPPEPSSECPVAAATAAAGVRALEAAVAAATAAAAMEGEGTPEEGWEDVIPDMVGDWDEPEWLMTSRRSSSSSSSSSRGLRSCGIKLMLQYYAKE